LSLVRRRSRCSLARSDADDEVIGNSQRFVTAGKHLPWSVRPGEVQGNFWGFLGLEKREKKLIFPVAGDLQSKNIPPGRPLTGCGKTRRSNERGAR
ncbi:MAG: hypothetical protein WA510_00320, partial [Acidobacteriaceae bacterium]